MIKKPSLAITTEHTSTYQPHSGTFFLPLQKAIRLGLDGLVAACGRDYAHHWPHELIGDITVSSAIGGLVWAWFHPHKATWPTDPILKLPIGMKFQPADMEDFWLLPTYQPKNIQNAGRLEINVGYIWQSMAHPLFWCSHWISHDDQPLLTEFLTQVWTQYCSHPSIASSMDTTKTFTEAIQGLISLGGCVAFRSWTLQHFFLECYFIVKGFREYVRKRQWWAVLEILLQKARVSNLLPDIQALYLDEVTRWVILRIPRPPSAMEYLFFFVPEETIKQHEPLNRSSVIAALRSVNASIYYKLAAPFFWRTPFRANVFRLKKPTYSPTHLHIAGSVINCAYYIIT